VSDKPLTDICFENFDIHPTLLKGLEAANFIRCTSIQAMTLPLTLEGKDVAGQAQTGTGKTIAFLVALYNHLLTRPSDPNHRSLHPRAVIIAPTRELALQIDKDAKEIGGNTGIKAALIYGGVDYEKQRNMLQGGVDIVIATPGRLIDFVKQGTIKLGEIEIMVLDEADRMFDLGFIKDIRFLLRKMPKATERQNLLFSATLSHRVLELAYEHMNEPKKLVVETETITATQVRQSVYFPATEEKLPLLLGIIAQMDVNRSMIFVNTKIGCERVARTLERAGYAVGVLSGDVPQKKREKLLALFTKGKLSILVATDVAARGLHIPDVSHVFNYDLPFDAEDYVHRIGRTARLGEPGDAISFACDEYAMSLPDIEMFIEQKIPVARFGPELLAALPTTKPRTTDSVSQVSIVEDAIADATAERKRRRDRGDKRAGNSGARSPRASSNNGKNRETKRGDSQRQRQQTVKNSENSNPEEEHSKKRRRRRSRSNQTDKPTQQQLKSPGNDPSASNSSPPNPRTATPKFQNRIKQTIKSLANRLGMGNGR